MSLDWGLTVNKSVIEKDRWVHFCQTGAAQFPAWEISNIPLDGFTAITTHRKLMSWLTYMINNYL